MNQKIVFVIFDYYIKLVEITKSEIRRSKPLVFIGFLGLFESDIVN